MIRAFVCVFLLSVAALWLNNTSSLKTLPTDQSPRLIAHRGVHQIYAGISRTSQTCTANPIEPPIHSYIANTLPSIRAAFDAGADVVEIDVHLTKDAVFAVFHDWTLDCQTNGTGVTHEQDFAYLKTLDVGHGYSADGTTFPLRGSAIGQIPSLQAVMAAQPQGRYLINFKSNRSSEGTTLAHRLMAPEWRAQTFGVYGGERPTRAAVSHTPTLRGFDKASLKTCLLRYIALGWSGYVPRPCRDTLIAVPLYYGPWLWGWPHKFTDRMKGVGTDVILWGPYDGTGFSSGIDDKATLAKVPAQFDGYIWTNRIEVIGPALHP